MQAAWWRRPSYGDISYFLCLLSLRSNLQVGASGVEVEVQGLSANAHFADVLNIVGVWLGWNSAVLALDETEKGVQDGLWVGRSQAVLGVCLKQSKSSIAVVVVVVGGRDTEGLRSARLDGGDSENTRSCGGEEQELAGGNHFDGG